MIARIVIVTMALLGLCACQLTPKVPGESGQAVYYAPQSQISTTGAIYPSAQ